MSFATAPRKVPEAEGAARVRVRSSNPETLWTPPSGICIARNPSRAFRRPWRSIARSRRDPWAIANPAATSPLAMLRSPELTRLTVALCICTCVFALVSLRYCAGTPAIAAGPRWCLPGKTWWQDPIGFISLLDGGGFKRSARSCRLLLLQQGEHLLGGRIGLGEGRNTGL